MHSFKSFKNTGSASWPSWARGRAASPFCSYISCVFASTISFPSTSWSRGRAASFLCLYFLCACVMPSHAPLVKLSKMSSRVISLLIFPLCLPHAFPCPSTHAAQCACWRAVSFLGFFFLCAYQAEQEVKPRRLSVKISSLPPALHAPLPRLGIRGNGGIFLLIFPLCLHHPLPELSPNF